MATDDRGIQLLDRISLCPELLGDAQRGASRFVVFQRVSLEDLERKRFGGNLL